MSKKILVVDDNLDILDLIREILLVQGYEVQSLVYTDHILNDIASFQPDLVLVDFLLAGINGGELCAEIKNTEATKNLPVVILSAYPRVLDSLGNFGQDAFISKPFDVDEFLDVIERFAPITPGPGHISQSC